MATIHIQRNHKLGTGEARNRVDEIADFLREKLNADYAWEEDSLQFKCTGASGCIDVAEDSLELNIKLGMLLSPMKGAIRESIEQQVDEALASGRNEKSA
ncbi:MAG: polyhydroxyalkanoic acid system family protein [Pseudomonadota bacterium]|nr:polyhydroxyalkanoic acid system family protein [Pseudomonadota bacterium]